MGKKEILADATVSVNEKKPNAVVRMLKRIGDTILAIPRGIAGLWRTDKLVFFNIALLATVCLLLLTLLGRVFRAPAPAPAPAAHEIGYTDSERDAIRALANRIGQIERMEQTERAARPQIKKKNPDVAPAPVRTLPLNRPRRLEIVDIVVVRENGAPIKAAARRTSVPAPIVRRAAVPNTRLVTPIGTVERVSRENVIIDGNRARNIALPAMGVVNGNLILQNLRGYTLPCGIRINGDLLLRNVGQLKFCGCFEVTGNIYVSSNSSFGPIPRNARLGGQVIF